MADWLFDIKNLFFKKRKVMVSLLIFKLSYLATCKLFRIETINVWDLIRHIPVGRMGGS